MLNTFLQEIKQLLESAGVTGDIEVSTPPKPAMGDFAFPCFAYARAQGLNPAEAALELESRIKSNELSEAIVDVKAFGPYINFFLNTSLVAQEVITKIFNEGDAYGKNNFGAGKKIMIEYPSQNSHKEFHIGHLRNVCIGNSLVQLYRACGFQVTPVNYINDFGAHVVRCLWGMQKFHATEMVHNQIVNPQRWLGEVYAEASTYLKAHPECQTEVDELQVKLEARDPSIWPLFEETRQWSIAGFEEIQTELDCRHDAVFYESEVKDRGQEIVDELLAKKIATVGEKGAIIIDLSADELDVALLRKATGAGLYMTSDLALAEQKFSSHDIAESINITGIEQNFYFKQLFRVLQLNGFAHKMTHIGYGLVMLPEGKMSSRLGTVILYEGLRDQIYEHMEQEVAARHEDWAPEKVATTTHTLTQAILKFTMQKHEAGKNITFNFAEAVSFEGFSAPYLLYTIARINSVLRKPAPEAAVDLSLVVEPTEKQLLLRLAEYPEVIIKAQTSYNPSTITNYSFELAQAFSAFYHEHVILDPANPALSAARRALADATRQVLIQALGLLTIATVDEM